MKIHDSVFIKSTRCVCCKKHIDMSTGLQSQIPKEGDFSVCVYCGQLMVFEADKSLREANDEEMKEFQILSPSEFLLAQALSRHFKAFRARREN